MHASWLLVKKKGWIYGGIHLLKILEWKDLVEEFKIFF
jgi:hypothetical protein